MPKKSVRQLQRILLTLLVLIIASCSKGDDVSNFKTVLEQKAGEYTISVLSDTGTIKKGSNSFVLEFRKTGSSQLADVGKVELSPVMEMPGMAPMIGGADVTQTSTPGRYSVKGNLTMTGMWKMNLRFGADQTVRFNLNAQ